MITKSPSFCEFIMICTEAHLLLIWLRCKPWIFEQVTWELVWCCIPNNSPIYSYPLYWVEIFRFVNLIYFSWFELDYCSSDSKHQVQSRPKIKIIKLDFSILIFQKSSAVTLRFPIPIIRIGPITRTVLISGGSHCSFLLLHYSP